MSQRKSWTEMEDKVLKTLRQQQGHKKWSELAEIMKSQYGIEGRNGKQCRERYHNHLDQRISKLSWTLQEDQFLVKLHSKYGNRWALIARQIQGRTDNCVKNRFYSRFRRSIRSVNELIKVFWKKQFKQLKQSFISKVIQMTEELRTAEQPSKCEIFSTCQDIKCKLMSFSDQTQKSLQQNEDRLQSLYNLIKDINEFNKKNKRRGKKKIRQASDNEDGTDLWVQHSQKNKKQTKIKSLSSEVKVTKSLQEESSSISQKGGRFQKEEMLIEQKRMLQNSTEFYSSSDRELEKPSTQFEIFLSDFQDEEKERGKFLKLEYGFDINQFYSIQNLAN